MFLYVWAAHSPKGLFQAKEIRAAIITTSINSRRMIREIARNAARDQWKSAATTARDQKLRTHRQDAAHLRCDPEIPSN
jgi:hypothetical protein